MQTAVVEVIAVVVELRSVGEARFRLDCHGSGLFVDGSPGLEAGPRLPEATKVVADPVEAGGCPIPDPFSRDRYLEDSRVNRTFRAFRAIPVDLP